MFQVLDDLLLLVEIQYVFVSLKKMCFTCYLEFLIVTCDIHELFIRMYINMNCLVQCVLNTGTVYVT